MAFNVTFGSQGSFDVGFQNEAEMRVSFRRNNEFQAETQNTEEFNSGFQGGVQLDASFLNGAGKMWLPTGGLPGDLLAKKTEKDGDAEWITPANRVEQDNTKPITSAAVYVEIGNINALLASI